MKYFSPVGVALVRGIQKEFTSFLKEISNEIFLTGRCSFSEGNSKRIHFFFEGDK